MFSEGELIVYSGTGVCRVQEIVERTSDAGQTKFFYILKPLYQKCTISTPADSPKVFMRGIISRAEAEALVCGISGKKAELIPGTAVRRLAEYYEEKLRSHECGGLVDLILSIYAKKKLVESQSKKLGAVDERCLKRAEELLFGELAAALNEEKTVIADCIRAKIAANIG